MKKAIFLSMAILTLVGCNSDDVDPQANERYCASVKLSDSQYKIDKIKPDYHRENLPLADEYCDNYNKYVFNKIESDDGEATLVYDAPYLISDFDDAFYTVGLSKENGTSQEINALIVSSDFDLDNLDANIKLLTNNPLNSNYLYINASVRNIVEVCTETNCQDINWIDPDWREIIKIIEILSQLESKNFQSIDDVIYFDEYFSTSLNAHELSTLYNEISF
ncbi:hypothetical protein [Photobacterium sp. DNB22_13_2]